jgi:hypothetical protein
VEQNRADSFRPSGTGQGKTSKNASATRFSTLTAWFAWACVGAADFAWTCGPVPPETKSGKKTSKFVENGGNDDFFCRSLRFTKVLVNLAS